MSYILLWTFGDRLLANPHSSFCESPDISLLISGGATLQFPLHLVRIYIF